MAIPSYTTSRVAEAALALLQADSELTTFFDSIVAVRHEDIYLNELYKPPALLVAISSVSHDGLPSECWELDVTLDLAIVEQVQKTTVSDFSHIDVVDRIRVTLWGSNNGHLVDPADTNDFVTDGLTRFERLGKPLYFPAENQIRTLLRVTYRSYVNESMEFID